MTVEVRADLTADQQRYYVAAVRTTTELLAIGPEQVEVTISQTSPAERARAERLAVIAATAWTGC